MTEQGESPLLGEQEPLDKRLVGAFERLEAAYGSTANPGAEAGVRGAVPSVLSPSPDMTWREAAAHLRLALAVRGRSEPARLLPAALAPETRVMSMRPSPSRRQPSRSASSLSFTRPAHGHEERATATRPV